jgi:hypothetical protein
MTVDSARFERMVSSLEATTLRLAEVSGDLKLIAERQVSASGSIVQLERSMNSEREAVTKLEAKVDRWINRGWGAWGVVVLAFTLFTAIDFKRMPEVLPAPHYPPPPAAASAASAARP